MACLLRSVASAGFDSRKFPARRHEEWVDIFNDRERNAAIFRGPEKEIAMMRLRMWGGSRDFSDETERAIDGDPVWLALVKRSADWLARIEATK
jgi:hypothetical protein